MSAVESLRWVEPWELVSPDSARKLEAELRLEAVPGHPLYGVVAQAFGRRDGRDDIALALPDETFAVVHLTWISKPERSAAFPFVDHYATVQDLQARFDEDHSEYTL